MSKRVRVLWIWLWIGCTQIDEDARQQMTVHSEWATLHQAYKQAVSVYDDGQYSEAVKQFRKLHSRYPNSRAILEGVLLSELQDPEGRKAGYTRIQEYVRSHPGDVEFRLIQAKFHLQMGEIKKGRDDLELLLFNQSVHPWVLAQDPFLLHHKDNIDSHKLPFELIQMLEIDVPAVAIVDDAMDIRMSFLHLSSCRPYIPPFEIGLDVEPKKLNVYQETVDDIVVKTTFVQSVINRSVSKNQPTAIQIHCGSVRSVVTFPSVDVIDLTGGVASPQRTTLAFPDPTELDSADAGVPWTLYINHVEAQKGLWQPDVDG